ncbi:MAG TPA: hypothetical protein VGK40_08280 [Verrucomicrobiae bacterium]
MKNEPETNRCDPAEMSRKTLEAWRRLVISKTLSLQKPTDQLLSRACQSIPDGPDPAQRIESWV